MTKEQSWPDKIYGYHSTVFDITDVPIGNIQQFGKNPQSMMGAVKREAEYLRADIAAAREIDIVKATLEAAYQAISGDIHQDEAQENLKTIAPAAVLSGMSKQSEGKNDE